MRYITIPEPFIVRDAVTDEPLDKNNQRCDESMAERITFAKFVKMLTAVASGNPQSQLDPLTLIDIRNKVASLAPGQTWECTDDWYKILVDQTKVARGIAPQAILSAEMHLRAIAEAPTKAPATLAASAPS